MTELSIELDRLKVASERLSSEIVTLGSTIRVFRDEYSLDLVSSIAFNLEDIHRNISTIIYNIFSLLEEIDTSGIPDFESKLKSKLTIPEGELDRLGSTSKLLGDKDA